MSGGWQRRIFRLEVGTKRVERDLDEEMEFHLLMRTKKLIADGLDPATARSQALRQFGDLPALRAECLFIDHERDRAMKRASRLHDLRQDVTYGVRSLRQHKGYTAVILLILALGIGANTALFTLVDALMLRPLPVPHPEQLVIVGDPTNTGTVSQGIAMTNLASYPLYIDLRDQNRVASGLYATGSTVRLDVLVDRRSEGAAGAAGTTSTAEAEHPRGRMVSGNFFSVLKVPAFIGRTFSSEDDRVAGGSPVVVISHDYWQQRFAGDRSAVGRTIIINGTPFTIIGVAARGFTGDLVGQSKDLWIPVTMLASIMPNSTWLTDRTTCWLLIMGRLSPGVTLAQARDNFTMLVRRSLTEHATASQITRVENDLRDNPVMVGSGAQGFSYYRRIYAQSLVTLMAAVGLVLLVVCANVANLMLARAAARGREMSVRMALGAGRLRLVQQLLTESILVALGGGALGLLVAVWGSSALLRLAGGGGRNRVLLDVQLDGRVLAFTAAVSLLTAVLFGLVPALRATRIQLATALRAQGRGVAGAASSPGKLGAGKLLVVAQVALSTLLLVGTGMLVRSTQRLENAHVGIARDRLVIASIDARRASYTGPRRAAVIRDLADRVRQIPGVAGVSASENGLFSGTESGTTLQVEGFTARTDSDTLVASDNVGPGYFGAIGARLLQGRDVEAHDNESGAKVVVINETMARFFFPKGDVIGRHVTSDSVVWEIVGVVADVQGRALREPADRRIYYPMFQMMEPPASFKLQIRATGDPAALVLPVRRALAAADPSLVVLSVDPLTELIRDSISQDRLVAQVVTFFGALALVLAALGLYGVMAYATVRRTNEFGLRMALGADPRQVTRMVLREAMLLTALGVVVGLPLALAATQLLRDQLFGIGPFDLPSLALAVGVLGASAAVAGYLPALRASRVAPLDALRME